MQQKRLFDFNGFTRFSIYYYGFDTAIKADLARAIYILSTQGEEKGFSNMPFFIDKCNSKHLHFIFDRANLSKFVFSEEIVTVSAGFTSYFLLEMNESCFGPDLIDIISPTKKYKVNASFLNSLCNRDLIHKKNHLHGYPAG